MKKSIQLLVLLIFCSTLYSQTIGVGNNGGTDKAPFTEVQIIAL